MSSIQQRPVSPVSARMVSTSSTKSANASPRTGDVVESDGQAGAATKLRPPSDLARGLDAPSKISGFAAAQPRGKNISTILLDCDNTLVLSEELAFEACAELANEILASKGVSKRYDGAELLAEFVGHNFRGMIKNLSAKYALMLPEQEVDKYVERELSAVTAKLAAKATPCEGAVDVVESLYKAGKYKLAVVSSSAESRVAASLKKVGLAPIFPSSLIYSAATSLPVPTSKPDPAVYLHACKDLGVEPGECVAVEDSKAGAMAAKNAGIPLLGYVGSYPESEMDEKAEMLSETCGAFAVMRHWDEFAGHLERLVAAPTKADV